MSDQVILAIDDDELDLMALHRAVRDGNINCKVRAFSSPETALEALEGDDALNPLLILLDLNMPTMTGFEVLAHLKADPRLRQIPVVVLTTSTLKEDRERAYAFGVSGYIVKPMDYHHFVYMVSVLCDYWINIRHP